MKLIAINFWRSKYYKYTISVYFNADNYYFEGRRRATGIMAMMEGTMHIFFPYQKEYTKVGPDKIDVYNFLDRHLWKWECPVDVIEETKEYIKKWKM